MTRLPKALTPVLLVLGGVYLGCDSGPADSLYDPDAGSAPDPVISEVVPEGSALAAVDVITITGQNFSATAEDNLVYFGDARATVVEASATQLRVVSPNVPAQVDLRVAVIGAENFSNSVAYELEAASERFGSIASFEEPFALASDGDGNLYVSLFSDNRSAGIVRVTPDGTRSTFVETTFKWDDMAFGTDGLLYTVRGVRAVFRFAESTQQETWVVLPDNSASLTALAFDANGNLFLAGDNVALYRVATDESVSQYAFEADVNGLAVFENYLYAVGEGGGASRIWRFEITVSGDIGPAQEYFNLEGFNASMGLSLAFAANGDLFVGTDAVDPIVVVHPDGTGETLYPGLLDPAARSFAWGNGTTLYMSRAPTAASTPDIIRVNTRLEGAN